MILNAWRERRKKGHSYRTENRNGIRLLTAILGGGKQRTNAFQMYVNFHPRIYAYPYFQSSRKGTFSDKQGLQIVSRYKSRKRKMQLLAKWDPTQESDKENSQDELFVRFGRWPVQTGRRWTKHVCSRKTVWHLTDLLQQLEGKEAGTERRKGGREGEGREGGEKNGWTDKNTYRLKENKANEKVRQFLSPRGKKLKREA